MTHGAPVVTGNWGVCVLGVLSDPRPKAASEFLLRRGSCAQGVFLDIAKVIFSLGKQFGIFKILCENSETAAVDTAGTTYETLATSR